MSEKPDVMDMLDQFLNLYAGLKEGWDELAPGTYSRIRVMHGDGSRELLMMAPCTLNSGDTLTVTYRCR